MDFGVLGLEAFAGTSETTTTGLISLASDPETKQKWFLKQGRCGCNDDEWRSSKQPKFDDFSPSHNYPMLLQQKNTSLTSDGQQLLSFSAPKSEPLSVDSHRTSSQNVTFPYFHLTPSLAPAAFSRNTGYNTGCFNGANMYGVPFTPSQWMELEHQALIYKYITANVPIPSNLLIPIRKAIDSISSDLSCFSGGLLRPNTLGLGGFHLGFSNNTDPEPGRCRRTDGKKWRCSRDVVADQKYCERHMNRGRHRSRKPVEGKSARSAAATTATTNTKLMSTVSSSSAAVVGPTGGSGESNSYAIAHQQYFKNMQPSSGASNLSVASPLNRLLLKPPTDNLKSEENPFLKLKQQIPYEEKSRNEFGVVSSDSLLNPSHHSSAQDITSQETESQHSLRQFMDEWPKSQSDRSAVSWTEVDTQSDRTQLSISTTIPMAASDFMSSTSSPNNEKETLSPLRLSREYDPMHMGLGVGSVMDEPYQRQANWIPISWETSIGGPLGEVLHSTNNSSTEDCKNSSALNVMTEGWDHSPRVGSSPTGVLQKTAFGSVSNSSAGSSPRAENNKTRL